MVINLAFIGLARQTPGHHPLLLWTKGQISGHHPFLLRTRGAELPSHGEGGWAIRGWCSFIIHSLPMGRFSRLVVENVEGLVEGGGHGHHPLLLRIGKADPWSSPFPS